MAWNETETFSYWCQKVLPLVYDESLSYYEVLCKLMDYVQNIINNENELKKLIDSNTNDISELKEKTNEMLKELDKIKNGEYVDLYINQLASYIDNNLKGIVGRIVKYVSFGLTDSGKFIAYIPESWDFLSFDTEMNPNSELYGHLILTW